ncbi:MAG: hypothetical protein WCP39_07935, partial [Chlamydiota bacterium]
TNVLVNSSTKQVLFAIALDPAVCVVMLFNEAYEEGYNQGFLIGNSNASNYYQNGYQEGYQAGCQDTMQSQSICR